MSNIVESIEYKEYTINVYSDDNPESPREWDNLGKMVCWHERYDLGDEHDFTEPEDFHTFIKENPSIVLPIYGYDHSGLSISTGRQYPFNDVWDSGQLGYIYITLEKIRKEYDVKRVSRKLRQKITKSLQSEVEIYNDYLTGAVYGYQVVSPDNDDVDSCWGFYGYDNEESGLLEYAQNAIDYDIKERKAYLDSLQLRLDLAMT